MSVSKGRAYSKINALLSQFLENGHCLFKSFYFRCWFLLIHFMRSVCSGHHKNVIKKDFFKTPHSQSGSRRKNCDGEHRTKHMKIIIVFYDSRHHRRHHPYLLWVLATSFVTAILCQRSYWWLERIEMKKKQQEYMNRA